MDIRPISPTLIDDYLALFDNAFTDNPYWADCYCAFYDDPRTDEEWDAPEPGFAAQNRENRSNTIAGGNAYGLLAYRNDRPVGWVNAGPRDQYGNLRTFAQAAEADDPSSIGAILCFVIDPEHRSQGVATALLGGVDDYFRELELAVAEGYPRSKAPTDPELPWSAAYFKGSPDMYERAGYRPHREYERFVSVRKTL